VQFVGEEGVDAGGLVREWFGILAREIFNPNYALFLPANGRPSTFLINPASSVNPDHLSFFRFCGRIIGKAIYENQRLDCYFVRSFYKHMLGRPVTWHDMEAMDPDYYRNLKWILECQDEEMLKALDLTFTIEESDFGKTNVVELIPNGSNIPVTQQNKQEYVQKVCEHKMTSGIQDQLQAFLEGFHELIPSDLVGTLFDDKELELLIAGLPTIDVEDLKRNTEYVNYSSQDPQIKWFWKCLENDFTEDEMAWFLQFVTGSTQVPLEGFQALTGMRGPQKFSIHKAPGDKTRLPSAHTCFNQLDLPDYDTEDVLKAKLKQAVCEAHEGFGFI
ncbi:E3 ubiquitin-protein ligase, partial [Perkinsus olseni]